MAYTILDGPSTTAVSLAQSDGYMISSSGSLFTGGNAITTAPGSTIIVNGAVTGNNSIYGYAAQAPNTFGYQTITVGIGGNLAGRNGGISLDGAYSAYITNNGSISGISQSNFQGTFGISLATTTAQIQNNGFISGADAILIVNSGLSASNVHAIFNSGTITGVSGAISVYLTSTNTNSLATFMLRNTGTVSARTAFSGGPEPDLIVNAGTMMGAVSLGDGADSYDGALGRVAGVVSGGLGADILIGGAGAETFYGDNVSGDTSGGADILMGGYGDDVLNGGYGADVLYGNQDNDVLYGNQDNDWLHGGQGDDLIYGGQGNDVVNGGRGDDVLYGNLGDDRFEFTGPGFGHDRIADFRASGANDIIVFTTDIFGDFAAVQAGATAVSNGTLLTDAGGDTLLLVGVAPGALTAAMFVFG